VRHYVLTRSYRSPDYPLDANLRRIEITRRITAPSLRAQGTEWTWIVYINPTDPLLDERLDAFRSAGAPVIPLPIGDAVEDVIDWSGSVLTTRIDDDDAFARNAFRRLRRALRHGREVLVFPHGHRVNAGQVMDIRHLRNAWSSLMVPKGVRAHIRQAPHQRVKLLGPRRWLDPAPAWLWVRHQDAETWFRHAERPITDDVRALYDVDWDFLEELA
jgi:hypothetical protein